MLLSFDGVIGCDVIGSSDVLVPWEVLGYGIFNGCDVFASVSL